MTTDEFRMNLILLGFEVLSNGYYIIPSVAGVTLNPDLERASYIIYKQYSKTEIHASYQRTLDKIMEVLGD